MNRTYQLPFKKGQTAEARSFMVGFRAAWFRCKIHEISHRRGHWRALLEYFDYPDEKWAWTKIYQVPRYRSGKSEEIRKLILRPEYPRVHHKNEVSDVSSNSDVTIDSTLKAGDLVDWWNTGCYWSGKVTKLLGNDKAEIELLPPPLGEGATYEVFIKDVRPSLDWSPEFGWAVPASQDGESSCQNSQLLEHVGRGKRNQQATESSLNSSFSGGLSCNLPPKKRDFRNIESADSKDATANTSGLSSSLEMRSSTPVSYVSSTPQCCTLPPQPPAPADDAQAPAARQLQPERTDSRARLQIMPQGAGFNPPIESIHDALRVSINRHYHYPYPSWGEIPKRFRKSIFDEYKALCVWLPKYKKITFRKFEKAAARMADWFYIARRDKRKPDWVPPHLYDQLLIYWLTPEFLAKSAVAKKARRRTPLSRFNAT